MRVRRNRVGCGDRDGMKEMERWRMEEKGWKNEEDFMQFRCGVDEPVRVSVGVDVIARVMNVEMGQGQGGSERGGGAESERKRMTRVE